jgi:hypothetical protein
MVKASVDIARRVARGWVFGLVFAWAMSQADEPATQDHGAPGAQFQTSDRCLACHNGMTTARGEELSIGIDWRTSLMANSSRDPYWQASVRRESIDHSGSQASIEDECSACHMPIVHYKARQEGELGRIFIHLPLQENNAADGVSCSVCHQITRERLGTEASFNGNFVAATADAAGEHPEFGPFDIDPGLQRVMHSSTGGFQPTRGDQIRSAELCASCHTLITKALGADGRAIASFPEQVPYQEWLHSDYRQQRTCQSCHMPAVQGETPIARILGIERPGVARHEFVAANFFLQRMFERYHDELRLSAQPQELAAAADRTVRFLQSQAARLSVSEPRINGKTLTTDVLVENLGGHKLPTAYPSRRAWLHLVVLDGSGLKIFESGALHADGSIEGNDNDADPTRYEPHYREIHRADEVQIYESILEDAHGAVTTGLLSTIGYLKDNRLLPHGFDKSTAGPEIAVHGAAADDPDFSDRGDRVRYVVELGPEAGAHRGPYKIEAELWYQPIGYRWASNLKAYDAPEPRRFNDHFDAMSQASATLLARAQAVSR